MNCSYFSPNTQKHKPTYKQTNKVYKGILCATNEAVAIKVVKLDGTPEDEAEVALELAVLKRWSHHPNIAGFFGAFRRDEVDEVNKVDRLLPNQKKI